MKGKLILLSFVAIVFSFFLIGETQPVWAAEKPGDYPKKPINLYQGFPVGGVSDIECRIIGEALKKVIGQSVIVEAKPGAGGQIMLTDFTRNAKPDGYEMCLMGSPHLQGILFDPVRKAAFSFKDLQPIANHVEDSNVVMVRKDSPFKTIEDFLASAKAKPGQISISTSGIGGDDHLAVLDLQLKSGVTFNIVHMRGDGDAFKALLGGHIDSTMANIGGTLPMVVSGQSRILAVMMDKRYPDLGDVPTFKEKGMNVINSSSRGFFMPARTPMTIVKYMEESIKKAMEDPEHIERAKNAGLILKFMGIEEYTRFLEEQNTRVKELIKFYRK